MDTWNISVLLYVYLNFDEDVYTLFWLILWWNLTVCHCVEKYLKHTTGRGLVASAQFIEKPGLVRC